MNFNFGHVSAKYQGYSLTFWPKLAHFHHFSMLNQTEWMSFLGIYPQNTKGIALLFGRKWIIFITFNAQSNWMTFNSGHLSVKCEGYSRIVWPKMAHFHQFSVLNQIEWISILVIVRQNTKVIALLLGQKWLNIITFPCAIKLNEFQFWSCFGKLLRLLPYRLAKNGSFSSLFNVQSKWMKFNFGDFSAKYQGYSLTFWPNMAHFHHFSMCNQNEWISMLVMLRQNTNVIALLFGQKWLIFITFQCAIKMNEFQFWSFVGKIPKL